MKTFIRTAKPDGTVIVRDLPLSFAIRPHKEAPLFVDTNPSAIISQLIDLVSSSPEKIQSREVLSYFSQAGLVSLWFFLKFIAGVSGPYSDLDTDLHLDMCNFRQSDYCMAPGARAAAFIPRGYFKSTCFSHGANTWELTRDANVAIRLVNAVVSNAEDFMRLSKHTIESWFYGLLYPDRVPRANAERWNNTEIVMPNRTRDYREPSIKPSGVSGAGEGYHHTLINPDDIVGLDSLDSSHRANTNMETAKKWLNTNTVSLLRTPREDRIVLVATRYAADDCYAPISDDAHTYIGANSDEFFPTPGGTWAVYYRLAVEEGEAINPGIMTKDEFESLLLRDPWTALSQYANSPKKAGIVELAHIPPQRCTIFFSRDKDDWIVRFKSDDNETVSVLGRDLTWVMAIDPAGTDSGISARTSRSSVGVTVMDNNGNAFRVWARAGYYSIETLFDVIYEGFTLFFGYLNDLVVESNAMQKILGPVFKREIEERAKKDKRILHLNPIPMPASGDKEARIRTTVGWFLENRKFFIAEGAIADFEGERQTFPSRKLDVLDECEKALTFLRRPLNAGERERLEDQEIEAEMVQVYTTNVVGY